MESDKMSDIDTKMVQPDGTSLLILDEYCLMDICQFLEVNDFANLKKTCTLLRDVSARVCAQKFKKLEVEIVKDDSQNQKHITKKEFLKILSMIENYVFTVDIRNVNQEILEIIRLNCKNLKNLTLWRDDLQPVQLQDFRNLKELNLSGIIISSDDLKKYFESNPDITGLVYQYNESIMELLTMLPKLKGLHLTWLPASLHQNKNLQNLLQLKHLTKFSFSCKENCNELLRKLSKNLKLRELNLYTSFNGDTFDVIRTFQDVTFLFMATRRSNIVWIPERTVLPPNLKNIKLMRFKLTCTTFLSIIKKHKFLEEVEIYLGQDKDNCKHF